MQHLASLAIVLVCVYAGLCVLLYVFQSRMVFFPSRTVSMTPGAVGLAFEDLTIESPEGARIAAWHVPAPNSRATLLFCHGNAGNISNRIELIQLFHRIGLDVFIFDYQGYGRSSGSPSEAHCYADALACWRYLTEERGVPAERIVPFGRSLGGPIAAWLAARHRPGALVLEATFTSLADVGKHHYPFFPVRLLARLRLDTAGSLRSVHCPVLITHGPADEVIPFEHGRALYALASDPKQFLELRGLHDDGCLTTGEAYIEAFQAFLARHVNGEGTTLEAAAATQRDGH